MILLDYQGIVVVVVVFVLFWGFFAAMLASGTSLSTVNVGQEVGPPFRSTLKYLSNCETDFH